MGRYIDAGGAAVLVVGLTVAFARHDGGGGEQDAADKAASARYDAALRRASVQPIRVAVSYVEIPLSRVSRFSRGRYKLVQTEVARRLSSGRRALHPDFAALADGRTDPEARVFREHRGHERQVYVVALLVTPTTQRPLARARLEVERLAVDGFVGVWDASDLLPRSFTSIFRHRSTGPRRKQIVRWVPRAGQTAVIPLSLMHWFLIPQTPSNEDVIHALGESTGIQATSSVVLGPLRLVVRPARGRPLEIGLEQALTPIVLSG